MAGPGGEGQVRPVTRGAGLGGLLRARGGGGQRVTSIELSDPGRPGRSAYTYFHVLLVARIIVTAVGDELTITHPSGHADGATIAAVLGGPALFLAGHALFKRAVFGVLSVQRLVAVLALAALVPVGLVAPPLLLASAATLVVAGVAAGDSRTSRADLPAPATT
jgi:low temperature requirement protein LtrA